jgi:hypothetical protein
MFLAGEAFYARLNPEFWDPPLPPMSEAEPKTGVLPPAKMPRLPSEEGPVTLCFVWESETKKEEATDTSKNEKSPHQSQ